MKIVITTQYSDGEKFFAVNTTWDAEGPITRNSSSCGCGQYNRQYYVVKGVNTNYYVPVENAEPVVEGFTYKDATTMMEQIGDDFMVHDYSPYRIQNDQAAIQRLVNDNPM
jgi:hypothetical protein